MIYDTIIIGGGPAGLTASLYAGRAGLNNIIIEKAFIGGQASQTYSIENYPGFLNISGSEFMLKMDAHVKEYRNDTIFEEVIDIDVTGAPKKVITNKNIYEAKTIVITTGAKPRKLGLKNESTISGIHYCATCDGFFYRNKVVAIIGGGNTAVEDAVFLSRFCKKVYIIHRRDTFRAEKAITDTLFATENIQIIYNSTVERLIGDEFVEQLELKNTQQSTENKIIDIDGVFVAVGVQSDNTFAKGKLNIDESGYIITTPNMETNVGGIFAAGDARNTNLRQVITAAADGAVAAYYCSSYIAREGK